MSNINLLVGKNIKKLELFLYALALLIIPQYLQGEYSESLFKNTNLTDHYSIFYHPPFIYEKNEMLYVRIKTDKEVIQSLVPEQLQPNKENEILFYIGNLNMVSPFNSPYQEGGIIIPVTYIDKSSKQEKFGFYVPILYLEDVAPIMGGREAYGFNKFYSTIEFSRDEKTIHASVTQWGVKLIEMDFRFSNNNEITENHDELAFFTTKRIPSVKQDGTYDVKQLTQTMLTGITLEEEIQGGVEFNLGSTEWDPLDNIPIREIVGASFRVEGGNLNSGTVYHDYLQD